jgi:hypothetical protein
VQHVNANANAFMHTIHARPFEQKILLAFENIASRENPILHRLLLADER